MLQNSRNYSIWPSGYHCYWERRILIPEENGEISWGTWIKGFVSALCTL